MSTNKAVTDFLDYYVSLDAPEYAVMLKGEWGSGKTWFIKDYLARKYQEESDKKLFIYQSLYGVRSITEIEDAVFTQLHPWLASKGAKLIGGVLKRLAMNIGVDLNQDGRNDGGVKFGTPQGEFFEAIKSLSGRLLIFDDLERCKIPLTELLGYINQFVEHDRYRVILLANEAEIPNKEPSYAKTKEKLIGRTFDVETDVNAALTSFLDSIKTPEIKAIFEKNQRLIIKAHEQSGYKNLRILKHSLHDFERICKDVNSDALKCEPLMTDFLQQFLCFSFEIKVGAITPDEIQAVMSSPMKAVMTSMRSSKEPSAEEKKYQGIATKYDNGIKYLSALVSAGIWQEIFHTGFAPIDKLNEAFANCKYLINVNRPNWVKLWHSSELTDKEYARLLLVVRDEWGAKHYTEATVVLHVAGMLMRGGKFLKPNLTKRNVLTQAKAYITVLKKQSQLQGRALDGHSDYFERTASHGLGYASKDEPEFTELWTYLLTTQEQIQLASYPKIAEQLLTALTSNDADEFLTLLCESRAQNISLSRVDILNYVNKKTFFAQFLEASPIAQERVFWAFHRRYEHLSATLPVYKEHEWLVDFNSALSREIKKRSKLNSSERFASLQSYYLNPILETFKKLTPEPSQKSADGV